MKILMTGLHGTVAPVVATYAELQGHTVTAFDRDIISVENEKDIKRFIQDVKPDAIFHLGMGSLDFTKILVDISKDLDIKFLYTSTVMVFDGNDMGPFDTHVKPLPKSDYGIYKLQSEALILKHNPNSHIVRLGWQIGHNTSGNQMIAHLKKEYLEKGCNKASQDVFLACSLIIESAKKICEIIDMKPGIYHVDQSGTMSYYDVLCYLKKIHPWITPKRVEQKAYNNQLVDDKIKSSRFY